MKVTKFFGLWILSVLCVLSCTDEEQGTGNLFPMLQWRCKTFARCNTYAGNC